MLGHKNSKTTLDNYIVADMHAFESLYSKYMIPMERYAIRPKDKTLDNKMKTLVSNSKKRELKEIRKVK